MDDQKDILESNENIKKDISHVVSDDINGMLWIAWYIFVVSNISSKEQDFDEWREELLVLVNERNLLKVCVCFISRISY